MAIKQLYIMKSILTLLLILTTSISFSQTVYQKGNILSDTMHLDEISVGASYSAKKETPFTFKNLSSSDIELSQSYQEPAVLLSQTPSISYYSDNGLGTGYVYYRLRGIDQSRINSTLNGVPLNEPEDQGIYYNNYANFLGSIGSVQIIRGAGLSKPGVSSYGGSINFNSKDFSQKTEGHSSVSYGSYEFIHGSFGINSKNIFINANYQGTSGYKWNSDNRSFSTFYGGKWKKFSLYGFIGDQNNAMAWIGEPLDSLKKDPRHNSNTQDERDRFTQVHNQLKWENRGLSITGYHTYLKGWYDIDLAHFDPDLNYGDLMYRIGLRSNWLGSIINYNYNIGVLNSDYGVSAFTYYRDHEGFFNGESGYQNTGYRDEVSPYIKGSIKLGRISIYGDVQYRYTTFRYDGLEEFDRMSWNFINWSSGASVRFGDSYIYYGIGRTNREPTRTDLFSGYDDFSHDIYNPVLPERALNNEIGYKLFRKKLHLSSNLYYMNFSNEIVLNGQYGPNAILLHQNAAKSFRSGWEVDGIYKTRIGLIFSMASSVSYNRISQDGQSLRPVLSPSTIINGDIRYQHNNNFYFGINSRYIGSSYIDFSNENKLDGYTIQNFYAGSVISHFTIKACVNNIFNRLILANAVMSENNPLYFAMAGINYSLSISYKF
jgi:iron complex outermembrane receptor protein